MPITTCIQRREKEIGYVIRRRDKDRQSKKAQDAPVRKRKHAYVGGRWRWVEAE